MASAPLIALDARCTRQMSVGMKRYAQELAARLPVIAPDLAFSVIDQGENFGLAEQVRLPLALLRMRPALVHHFSLYAPLLAAAPTIVTIHDLIHLEFPQYFKAHIAPYYQFVVRTLLKRADPKKIRVIPLGVDQQFLHPQFDQPGVHPDRERPYIFYAGNHRPHKNLATLLSAWAALDDRVPYDLVLTGHDDFDPSLQRQRPNGAQIFCLGDISDEQLVHVMHAASALVYPSLSEGFGLPMLEALALGTPVIASDMAVPGILRDACIVVEARNISAWSEAITQLKITGAEERRLIRAYSGAFTWDRCAVQTAACYREVLEEQKSRVR
jgi:glycosyltransferase involved in cell wall biosynthesis